MCHLEMWEDVAFVAVDVDEDHEVSLSCLRYCGVKGQLAPALATRTSACHWYLFGEGLRLI